MQAKAHGRLEGAAGRDRSQAHVVGLEGPGALNEAAHDEHGGQVARVSLGGHAHADDQGAGPVGDVQLDGQDASGTRRQPLIQAAGSRAAAFRTNGRQAQRPPARAPPRKAGDRLGARLERAQVDGGPGEVDTWASTIERPVGGPVSATSHEADHGSQRRQHDPREPDEGRDVAARTPTDAEREVLHASIPQHTALRLRPDWLPRARGPAGHSTPWYSGSIGPSIRPRSMLRSYRVCKA